MDAASVTPAGEAAASARTTARRFLEILVGSEAVYCRLLELTRGQGGVIGSGSPEDLIRLARAKETELRRLRAIEESLPEMRQDWNAIQAFLSEEDRRAVRDAAGRVEHVLRQLLALEQEQEAALREAKDETLASIRRVEAGRRVQLAYGQPSLARRSGLDHTE